MPQENQVLQCFSCGTFQVHIVKKAIKWECKVCGAKQSFKRHFGKGSGKDCRNHVMKLNELRFTKSYSIRPTNNEEFEETCFKSEPMAIKKKAVSKWAQYLDEEVIDSENDDTVFKSEKNELIIEEHDEIKNVFKALDTDSDKVTKDQTNTKHTSCQEVEENTIERQKSKYIFGSDLDDADDFLNFI